MDKYVNNDKGTGYSPVPFLYGIEKNRAVVCSVYLMHVNVQ